MSKIANHLRTFAIAVFSLLTGSAFVATEAHYFANDGKLILPDAYTRWCATRGNTIGAHVNSDFRITIPQPKARYQVDPVLPAFQQMVELTAASASDVEWFVNGASCARARRAMLLPARRRRVEGARRQLRELRRAKDCRRKHQQLAHSLFARFSTEDL